MPDQRSLTEQIVDVYSWAREKGMYDACDWLDRAFFGVGREASRYSGSMTCSHCGKTWEIGSHVIGSATHMCPEGTAQYDGEVSR